MKTITYAFAAVLALGSATAQAANLTIATVNNGDMIRMQKLTQDFTTRTGHTVEWVTLEENVLRQRVTTDITTRGGAFDLMTIGMYETPIWGKNGWLVPLNDLSKDMMPVISCQPWRVVYLIKAHCTPHLFTVNLQ